MIPGTAAGRRALTLLLASFAATACAPGALERIYHPADHPGLEITAGGPALVRSVYCDIAVEHLAKGRVEDLLERTAEGRRCLSARLGPLRFFHVIVRSTVDMPIRVERAEILHDGGVMASLDAGELRRRLGGPGPSRCDPGAVFHRRRLLEERASLSEIDIGRDTVESRLDFIPPRDTVEEIFIFDRIPSAASRFTIRFTIDATGRKRNVDVRFEVIERRIEAWRGR